MAKTSTIDIIPGLEESFFSALTSADRFTYARVRRKNSLLSLRSKKGISQKSLLPLISIAWATLNETEKAQWSAAGAECNLNGWRLFVQDFCARRVNNLEGIATPSELWQCWIGQIKISSPASEAKLIQIHPRNYHIYRKVTGTKSMYSPVLVTEDLSFPLTVGLNYKSNLISQGAGSFAKMYANIWYSYQGRNLYHQQEINLDLISDWTSAETTITELETILIRYDLIIHLYNVRGSLFFDNVRAEHSGQNWARDFACKDINQGFTRNFYQIPKHWSALIAPAGTEFESIYGGLLEPAPAGAGVYGEAEYGEAEY